MKEKLLSGIVLVVVALAVRWSHQPKFVPLYFNALHPTEVNVVSEALLAAGYEHTIQSCDIWVVEGQVIAARASVAEQGLPKRVGEVREFQSTAPGKTSAEQKAIRQRLLEGSLTESLRLLPGVRDARVVIAVPGKCFPPPEPRRTRARVLLKLARDHQFTTAEVRGMHHMISLATPEMRPRDVKIIDSNMRDVTEAYYPQAAKFHR